MHCGGRRLELAIMKSTRVNGVAAMSVLESVLLLLLEKKLLNFDDVADTLDAAIEAVRAEGTPEEARTIAEISRSLSRAQPRRDVERTAGAGGALPRVLSSR
jgi:hypothetical protein